MILITMKYLCMAKYGTGAGRLIISCFYIAETETILNLEATERWEMMILWRLGNGCMKVRNARLAVDHAGFLLSQGICAFSVFCWHVVLLGTCGIYISKA